MKKGLLVVALAAMALAGYSQAPVTGNNGIIRCYTTEMEAQRRAANPKMQTVDQFEAWMAGKLAAANQSSGEKVAASRVIPTVVHVIYSNPAGVENISDAQVFSQIDILNEDFGRTNPDTTNTPAAFLPAASNTDIEFCLAQIDPMGNPTNGINRVQIAGGPFTSNTVDNTIKPATQWDPNQYFNIWVCNLSGGLLGYAQFPDAPTLAGIGGGNGPANTDGCVVLYSSVGRAPANPFGGPYAAGRTATHEVGHWLGLRHIWGDGGCAVDDFCADTPQSDNPNFGCPVTHVSCSSTDMVQNYMDYTDDACMNIFTQDQKARMDVVLGSSPRRASLLTSTVCFTAPEITFVTANTSMTESSLSGATACRGFQDIDIPLRIGGPPAGAATVTLTTVSGTAQLGVDYDVITGSAVFPSGVVGNQAFRIRVYDDAAVEVLEDLTIGFTISGSTDAYAGAPGQHTLNINDNDFDPSVGGTANLFAEDFESGGAGWTVGNAAGNNQWAIAGTAGVLNGTRSSYISRNGGGSFTYQANSSSTSRLRSPAINATGISNMTLSFDFQCNGEINGGNLFDYGFLSYSLNGTTFFNFVGNGAGTPFQGVSTTTNFTVALPAACNNTTFYLGFNWINDNSVRNNPPFIVDDISITASAPIPVETDLNSSNTEYLGPNSTVYWYDQTSGEVMLMVNNATNHDYGCTQVQVDRAGTAATPYMDASLNYACTDKTFLVTPTNNNASGSYDVRLYYSQTEIAGWETVTGQARGNIGIAKTNGPISNITPIAPNANGPGNVYAINVSRGTFATNDFWVEGQFATGFSGFAGGIENLNPVPVEFVSLDARWENEDAVLAWETGEFGNLRTFVVERSLDGGAFQRLGEVIPGAAEGSSASHDFLDRGAFALQASQLNYRIRAVDWDGGQTFSEVVFLRPGQRIGLLAWPNPFQDRLSVRVDLPAANDLSIELVNGLGQIIVSERHAAAAGTNSFELDVDGELAAGIYLLRVKGANFTERQRLLKD